MGAAGHVAQGDDLPRIEPDLLLMAPASPEDGVAQTIPGGLDGIGAAGQVAGQIRDALVGGAGAGDFGVIEEAGLRGAVDGELEGIHVGAVDPELRGVDFPQIGAPPQRRFRVAVRPFRAAITVPVPGISPVVATGGQRQGRHGEGAEQGPSESGRAGAAENVHGENIAHGRVPVRVSRRPPPDPRNAGAPRSTSSSAGTPRSCRCRG